MATNTMSLKPHCIDGSAAENQKPNVANPLSFFRFFDGKSRDLTFQFRVPGDYASGAHLELIYDTEDGETGDIRLTAEVMCVSDGELANADSFATASAHTDTVEGTVGKTNALTVTPSNLDSIAAGDLCLVKLTRTPTHASDTVDADMRLFEIDFEYTTT